MIFFLILLLLLIFFRPFVVLAAGFGLILLMVFLPGVIFLFVWIGLNGDGNLGIALAVIITTILGYKTFETHKEAEIDKTN